MKTNKEIYAVITQLNNDVKAELKRKGLVVPLKKDDSTIQLGNYIIKKINSGFYNILDYREQEIIEGINLPQTAIIIANKLALGKWTDLDLLQIDKKYGFAMFDEAICRHSEKISIKKKNYNKADLMKIKHQIAKQKKEYYQTIINNDYQKLLAFR